MKRNSIRKISAEIKIYLIWCNKRLENSNIGWVFRSVADFDMVIGYLYFHKSTYGCIYYYYGVKMVLNKNSVFQGFALKHAIYIVLMYVTWFEHAAFWSVVRRSIQLSYTYTINIKYYTVIMINCQVLFCWIYVVLFCTVRRLQEHQNMPCEHFLV